MAKPRILVVEDAAEVAKLLARGFEEEGFEVSIAPNGEIALRRFQEFWDLIILDLMLPDVTGEMLLGFLAQKADRPPVLILSARSTLDDKLTLFRQGCDDYLTKPFAFEELLERGRALLRRPPRTVPEECKYEDMQLESETHELSVGAQKVPLTPKEFAICRKLMLNPGHIVSRRELLQSVWGLAHEPKTNFIEVHLANLRKKLGLVDRDSWLQTVRQSGIMLAKPEAREH